ncbi:hypothetical protein GOP47_0023412 [Adiantum capillus-veneris]|uniref:Uncharacterized protein n=1 Tax=Adiantum capillus-veneris TaxID=13818 RepID=A0A9D4Z538_ADICA|nr:hypothetical protein GOP47_0023412 [Adiantum capillus-veneris]
MSGPRTPKRAALQRRLKAAGRLKVAKGQEGDRERAEAPAGFKGGASNVAEHFFRALAVLQGIMQARVVEHKVSEAEGFAFRDFIRRHEGRKVMVHEEDK